MNKLREIMRKDMTWRIIECCAGIMVGLSMMLIGFLLLIGSD